MVQYNSRPTSGTPGARPFSALEVFRRLGVTVKTPSPAPAKETVSEEPVETEPVLEEPVSVVEEPVVEETASEAVAEPTPVEETTTVEEEEVLTPISELHLKKAYATALIAGGIETTKDLENYINSGKDLADLPGIGATSAKTVIEKFEAWQNEQNQMK